MSAPWCTLSWRPGLTRKPAHHELWVEKSTRLPSGTADTSFDLTGLSLSICATPSIRIQIAAPWQPMVVGLLPIVIRISRRRAFNEVADALPGVTDRVLGVLPRQAGHAFDAIPIAHQLGFRLFERLAFVTSVGIDAVTKGGTILVKGCPAGDVGPTRIVLAPVSFLGGGVDRIGDRIASQTAVQRRLLPRPHGPPFQTVRPLRRPRLPR